MTIIGSEIIKNIALLRDYDVTDSTYALKLTTLKNLLEIYFQSLMPTSTFGLKESIKHLGRQVLCGPQEEHELKKFKQDLNNFIARCLLPENYEELLTIIGKVEGIADINLPGISVIQSKFEKSFTNLEISELISKTNAFNASFDDLFIPINELLKVDLDSKQVYECIKTYYKKPQEDNRTLTATLMMLLSEERASAYFIYENTAEKVISIATPSLGSEMPAVTITPIITEVVKTATPPIEPEFRSMTVTPIILLFSSNRRTAVAPHNSNEQKFQVLSPNLSPILSPRSGLSTVRNALN